jgi:DnaK suppressor protein
MARKDALQKLESVLLSRREALRKALAGDLSLLRRMSNDGGDFVDAAMETAQDELNSQLAQVESRELAKIDLALSRFREGSFGQCEGCDKAIPLGRLQALPYASLCIDCQRKHERGLLTFDSASEASPSTSNAS